MIEDTLPKLLIRNAKKYGHSRHAMREKDYGIWQSFTWQEYFDHVKYFALGLAALGIKKDDKIAIIGDNRPEWIYAELASQCLGAIPIGIYQDSILKEVSYIIDLAGARLVVAEDQEQVDKIFDMREDLPTVEKVIYHDPKGMYSYDDPSLLFFPDVEEMGRKFEQEHPTYFDEHVATIKEDDVASIC
ncbi:MAG TPA: long-chain fatty acid--CoA ligase, partial [Proteobacteria bacterium]|nr:long-chain fatty acid--CoA ligase [Pseudomonadota bacterium]